MNTKDRQTLLTNVKQAAAAFSLSERFLRKLIGENRIPFYRLSERTIRVDLNELRDYMRLIAEGKSGVDDRGGLKR